MNWIASQFANTLSLTMTLCALVYEQLVRPGLFLDQVEIQLLFYRYTGIQDALH